MVSLLYVDLFCGAGGTSTGVELARDENSRKLAKVIACVNHDANAIASHAANHPDALHFTEDIRTLNLSPLVEYVGKMRQQYPEAEVVLWASLECTNFSKAKGGQARDADSRTLAEHLFRYIEAINPSYIQIENVEEFMSWGEVDEHGKPVSMDKGKSYQRWVRNVKRYGYNFDHRILNAADYGAYTSRKRFFGQFAKKGLPIVWPEPTHAKKAENTLFGSLQKWKPVKDVLDFSDEGTSIFTRKKPLSEKTLERIYAGLIRFVAGGKDAFMVKWNSMSQNGGYNAPSVDEPCHAVTCQNRLGIANVRFLSKYYSGCPESKNISVTGPSGAITCKDSHALVCTKFLAAYYGTGDNVTHVDNPCGTVTTKDRFNVVSPRFLCSYNFGDAGKDIQAPCPTLLTKDRLSLVSPFFMNYYSGGGQSSGSGEPCPAVTTVPKQRLVSPVFIDQQFGRSRPAGTDQPIGCITVNPKYNMVSCRPWVMNTNFGNVGSGVYDPAPVITANRKWHYLMNPQFAPASGCSVDSPAFTLIAKMDKKPPYLVNATNQINQKSLPSFIRIDDSGTITVEIYEDDSEILVKIKEFMVLYQIVDVLMRMLKIPELMRIMGFPDNYVLIGNQSQKKKFIGNAVEVNMARVLCAALGRKLLELKQVA
ncbi:DNA cytosine methyltransferase [Parabacteroides goldsteinii]|uniref:DNA cytosine methyltransferase n=1 Tax=Parabacteroides goldsteinii TaxID=328812 RepID=UPI003219E2A3